MQIYSAVDALRLVITTATGKNENVAGKQISGLDPSPSGLQPITRAKWDTVGVRSMEDAGGQKDSGLRGSKSINRRATLSGPQHTSQGYQTVAPNGQSCRGVDKHVPSSQSTTMNGVKGDFSENLASVQVVSASRVEKITTNPEDGPLPRSPSLGMQKGRQSRNATRVWMEQKAPEQVTALQRGRRIDDAALAVSVVPATDIGLSGEHRYFC